MKLNPALVPGLLLAALAAGCASMSGLSMQASFADPNALAASKSLQGATRGSRASAFRRMA
jgi:hypothetical protein